MSNNNQSKLKRQFKDLLEFYNYAEIATEVKEIRKRHTNVEFSEVLNFAESSLIKKLPEFDDRFRLRFERMKRQINEGTIKLSSSSFSKFMETPDRFVEYKCKDRKDPTPAMIKGSVLDCLLLTPDEFEKEFIITEVKTPSSANQKRFLELIEKGKSLYSAYISSYKLSAKAEKDYDKVKRLADGLLKDLKPFLDFEKSIKGRTIITQDVYEHCLKMKEAVISNRVAAKYILEEGEAQKKVEFEMGGFKWIGFLDKLTSNIIDLKKTVSADPRKVRREILYGNWKYQLALYRHALGNLTKPCYILAVDETCQVSFVQAHPKILDDAIHEIQEKLHDFKRCATFDLWEESYEFYSPNESGIYMARLTQDYKDTY